jgi:hypothetical protein
MGQILGLRLDAYAIDEDMYRYFNSVIANGAYEFTYEWQHREPAPVYSNFETGNGIFGPVMGK